MSQLVFNGHSHVQDEVGIKIDSVNIEDEFRRVIGRIEKWTIVGALKSTTAPALQSQMTALEAVYKTGVGYGDATFTAGANSHTLANAGAFGGVRVKTFGYMSGPWKMRTELANRRSFYAVLQAEYRYAEELYAYREKMEIIGTGASKWIMMPSLQALPEYQVLNLATSIKYVQRGVAVGRTAAPSANPPLLPAIIHGDVNRIGISSPKIITTNGTTQQEELFGIEWTYIGEASAVQTVPNFNLPTL